MKKYFLLFVLSLLLALPKVAVASTAISEASVSLVPTLTHLKVTETPQVLFHFTLKNDRPQEIDVRSISFSNHGSLALEPVLSRIEVLDDQGKLVSTHVRFFEDWDLNKDRMISSVLQIQIDSQKILAGKSKMYTIRAMVQGGVNNEFLNLKTDSVSVIVPETTFVRDLVLDVSDVDQKLIVSGGEDLQYAPRKVSLKDSGLLPDLVIEKMYFAKEYGYQKDVLVVPVCNKGNGPTPVGTRIEGTIYPSANYLRDFIIRKPLEEGKCFEQVFSLKRDLRINKAGTHSFRAQVDIQNLISEQRENNNERLDRVSLQEEEFKDPNTSFITDQSLSVRQNILARLGLTKPRPNPYNRTEVNENAVPRPFSFRTVQTARPAQPKSEVMNNETYLVHPNYGSDPHYLGTRLLFQEANPAANNIIRKELPTSAEEIWTQTKWERGAVERRIRLNRLVERVPEPTQIPEKDLIPTFREPNMIQKPKTSYRQLRSGVRAKTDYTGRRMNNLPWGTQEEDFAAFCRDSDGINPFIKGEVTYKLPRMPKERVQQDETRGDYVLEYYCEGDIMRRQLIKCKEGAEDGKCKAE